MTTDKAEQMLSVLGTFHDKEISDVDALVLLSTFYAQGVITINWDTELGGVLLEILEDREEEYGRFLQTLKETAPDVFANLGIS